MLRSGCPTCGMKEGALKPWCHSTSCGHFGHCTLPSIWPWRPSAVPQFLRGRAADRDPSSSFLRKTSLLSVLRTASRRSAAREHSWLWGSEPQERLKPGRSCTAAGAEATQPRRPEQTGQIPWLGCARLGGSGLPMTPCSDCFPDMSRLRCGLNRSC